MMRFEELGDLGEGTYGIVKKCRHKASGLTVAIKKFKDCKESKQRTMIAKTAAREVQVLQAIHHVNLIRLLDTFRMGRRLHLVFEYMEGTVLQALDAKPDGLGDFETRKIMWQLVKAADHLHSQDIVHRDIKPENMLLSRDGVMKLCDFGFARYMSMPHLARDMSAYVATRWYRAPELLLSDNDYGPKVDIWAIGCMLVEIQTGEPVFAGESDIDQLWIIMKSFTDGQTASLRGKLLLQRMQMPHANERQPLQHRFAHLEKDALEFLEACLHPHPDFRLSCKQLLQMRYFQGVESWFPPSFFAREEANAAKLAALYCDREPLGTVEKQQRTQSRPSRQRRRNEPHTPMPAALNISPLREQRFGAGGAEPDYQPSTATHNPAMRCADLRQGFARCKEDGELQATALLSKCNISPVPKAGGSTAPQIELTVRAGGPPVHNIGPPRKQGRLGDEFLSPDPRLRRKGRQAAEFQSPDRRWSKQASLRDHSHRAPSRLADNGRLQMQQQDNRKFHTPELSKMQGVEPEYSGPSQTLQPTRSRIPAFYGKHGGPHQVNASPSRWATRDMSLSGEALIPSPAFPWEPRGVQLMQNLSSLPAAQNAEQQRNAPAEFPGELDFSQQGHQLTMPGHQASHAQSNKSSLRWMSPAKCLAHNQGKLHLSPSQSPLRAQAPVFVPMAMQMKGKRAELH